MDATNTILIERDDDAAPIRVFDTQTWEEAQDGLKETHRRWAKLHGFAGKREQTLLIAEEGRMAEVWAGIGGTEDPRQASFELARLVRSLPPGTYRFAVPPAEPHLAALAWCLEAYSFDRYRTNLEASEPRRLVCPSGADRAAVLREAEAVTFVRDLVNVPANDLGPAELADAARALADRFGADCTVIEGNALQEGFPMVAAVGRAADAGRQPRLIEMIYGDPGHPKVTLVGKGVVFDTGGLDIKPAAAMRLMKKDMGGAANVLGLAQAIMGARLPVRLRVLIPAVENSISGSAFRPGDILKSRLGTTVEIGNTDAEGRLVLADALSYADEEAPRLIICMATLTGAARVALGPDLPPYFTEDEELARALDHAAEESYDPLWRLPLWAPYDALLASKVADVSHISSGPFAGSITAALFLKRFVKDAASFVHIDLYAWTPAAKPGRPEGGEAQTIRALLRVVGQISKEAQPR